MQILLNGEPTDVPDDCRIDRLLEQLGIDRRYCAVERNLTVVPREQHAACVLQAGDRIEIVTLVGGG